MLSDKELLVEAYQRGHAWNPSAHPNLQNLDMGRVLKMDGSEADAHELIRSRQLSDANYDVLVQAYHQRAPDYDGDIGPATRSLAQLPRCAMPDFAPPRHASFHYDNPELQAAVESYQEFAEAYKGGSGSWPRGCDPDCPDYHSVVVRLDSSNASSHQKSILKEVLEMVELTEAEMGQSVRHVVDGPYSNPQHDVKFQYIAGGVIGFAYFPTPNTCRQTVTARIDNSFNARTAVLAELLTHEYKGHSDGLEHTRGGIMNPSIGSPSSRSSWKGDPHEKTKARYFGGVAIPTTPTPTDPTIPTDPSKIVFRGVVSVEQEGKVLGRYHLVPVPEV